MDDTETHDGFRDPEPCDQCDTTGDCAECSLSDQDPEDCGECSGSGVCSWCGGEGEL